MAALDHQLDFLMHQPEGPGTSAGQAPRPGFHGPIHGQHQGCPYFQRAEQQQQQQQQQQHPGQQLQHHQSNLPLPHPNPHFHLHPISHQLPHQLSHQQPSPTASQNQSQTQAQTLHPQTNGNQPQPQQLPPLNPHHQPTLPYPHSHHPHHPSSQYHSLHSHYDPVHSAGSGLWYPGPRSGTPWPEPSPHPHSHPHPHVQNSQTAQQTHATHSRTRSELHFGGGGLGATSGPVGASGPGPVQPLLMPNTNPQFPPHHDHWMPFSLHPYHRPATYPRFSTGIPPSHPHNTNRPNHHQLSNNPQLSQQNNSPPNNQNQPGQAASSLHTPPTMSAERGGPLPSPRVVFHRAGGMRVSSLNQDQNQQNENQNPNAAPVTSGSGEPSQAVLPSPAGPSPLASLPNGSSRPLHREVRDAALSAARAVPQLPPLFPPAEPPQRADANTSNRSSAPDLDQVAISHSNPHDLLFANAIRRSARPPDYDSDEDPDSPMDDEEQVYRYMEEFGANNPHLRAANEDHIRATQLLRGQLSNKRVASKKALAQLQSVDMETLPESERICVICYNEFGLPTPEGIHEAPLRLPKCKHVFGDHCIKKWFEESDSCPYCRDKVHSEPAYPPNFRAIQNVIRASYLRSRPSEPASTSGGSVPEGDTMAFYRLVAQQDRDVARLVDHQGRAQDGARTVQTGERRSPPSEASETRRRTRARHGSFRTSASHTSGESAPPQRSPAHERVTPPGSLHWTVRYDRDSGRSLTSLLARQSMSMSGVGQRQTYNPMHPYPTEHQNAPPNPAGPPTGISTRGPAATPFNAAIYLPIDTLAAYASGPSSPAPFSQQLPPVGSLDATSFASPAGIVDGGASTGGGDWMQ